MQARQFSAPGIRNFLDVVKAGQLNDGVAAWHRIQSGLAQRRLLPAVLLQRPVRRRRPHDHPLPRRDGRQRLRAPRVELEPSRISGSPSHYDGGAQQDRHHRSDELDYDQKREPDNIGEAVLRRIEERLVLRHPDVARDSQGPPADQPGLRPHRSA